MNNTESRKTVILGVGTVCSVVLNIVLWQANQSSSFSQEKQQDLTLVSSDSVQSVVKPEGEFTVTREGSNEAQEEKTLHDLLDYRTWLRSEGHLQEGAQFLIPLELAFQIPGAIQRGVAVHQDGRIGIFPATAEGFGLNEGQREEIEDELTEAFGQLREDEHESAEIKHDEVAGESYVLIQYDGDSREQGYLEFLERLEGTLGKENAQGLLDALNAGDLLARAIQYRKLYIEYDEKGRGKLNVETFHSSGRSDIKTIGWYKGRPNETNQYSHLFDMDVWEQYWREAEEPLLAPLGEE